jgi:tetratricopeptide (TPR) repeat protein
MAKTRESVTGDAFELDELVALARVDIERGVLDQALLRLKQVLADKNPPGEALGMAARLYAQLGLFTRAATLYQRFLETSPGAVTETFQLGMTHFDAGQTDDALKIWEGLLKEFPTHPPALFYKGLVLAQQGRMADAKHAIEILMKSAPADNLYFGRGKELLQSIDTDLRSGLIAGNADAPKRVDAHTLPKDAYKGEH